MELLGAFPPMPLELHEGPASPRRSFVARTPTSYLLSRMGAVECAGRTLSAYQLGYVRVEAVRLPPVHAASLARTPPLHLPRLCAVVHSGKLSSLGPRINRWRGQQTAQLDVASASSARSRAEDGHERQERPSPVQGRRGNSLSPRRPLHRRWPAAVQCCRWSGRGRCSGLGAGGGGN